MLHCNVLPTRADDSRYVDLNYRHFYCTDWHKLRCTWLTDKLESRQNYEQKRNSCSTNTHVYNSLPSTAQLASSLTHEKRHLDSPSIHCPPKQRHHYSATDIYDSMQLVSIICTYFVSATVSAIICNEIWLTFHSKHTYLFD